MTKLGRPTKYDNELLTVANDYVEKCYKGNSIPYIEELALILDINDDTIVEWAKEHTEFSATVRKLKILQGLRLKQGALCKQLQPTTAIFLLKANHGLNEAEKGQPDQVTGIHIHYIGTDPKNLEDAVANKESAIEELGKAEKAIENFNMNNL